VRQATETFISLYEPGEKTYAATDYFLY